MSEKQTAKKSKASLVMKKRIYIIYTGGTLGMKRTKRGYAPYKGYLQKLMALMPELNDEIMPLYEINEYDPLLDSANMTPKDWRKVARDIEKNYHLYDGFLILHGTDTMAYTASALAFMLKGLTKPVILTGSQIPLCEVRNDASKNIVTALLIAANYQVPEVCLFFGSTLLRGCRATKADATGFNAFISPNFPPLGNAGIEIEIKNDLVSAPSYSGQSFEAHIIEEPMRLTVLRLFPGISAKIVQSILKAPLKGAILETYGVGNACYKNNKLMEVLEEATKSNIVIVNCTQCIRGTVQMDNYVTGSALEKVGVISGYDMTIEATLAKMYYLFGLGLPPSVVKDTMQKNLRGEITLPRVSF